MAQPPSEGGWAFLRGSNGKTGESSKIARLIIENEANPMADRANLIDTVSTRSVSTPALTWRLGSYTVPARICIKAGSELAKLRNGQMVRV